MADIVTRPNFHLGRTVSSLFVGHHKESAFSINMYHLETFGSSNVTKLVKIRICQMRILTFKICRMRMRIEEFISSVET